MFGQIDIVLVLPLQWLTHIHIGHMCHRCNTAGSWALTFIHNKLLVLWVEIQCDINVEGQRLLLSHIHLVCIWRHQGTCISTCNFHIWVCGWFMEPLWWLWFLPSSFLFVLHRIFITILWLFWPAAPYGVWGRGSSPSPIRDVQTWRRKSHFLC